MSHQLYDEDTQAYKSNFYSCPEEITSPSSTKLLRHVFDAKSWRKSNQLQINDDADEIMLIAPKRIFKDLPLPESINIGDLPLKFSQSL